MPYKDKEMQKQFQRNFMANKNKVRRFCVIQFFGGSCIRCGLDDIRCLQIDHIKPIFSDKFRGQGTVMDIYMDRVDLDDLQILCANCHVIKTYIEDIPTHPGYLG